MTLNQNDLSAIGAARTPEEAYKIFAGVASKLIGEAIAKAVSEAVGGATGLSSANPNRAGWEKYVSGITISGNWGTPGILAQPSSTNTFISIGDDALLGGSISISGSWSF